MHGEQAFAKLPTSMKKIFFAAILLSLLAPSFLSAAETAPPKPMPADDAPLSETDLKLREAIMKGASMEEIAKLKEPAARTPEARSTRLKAATRASSRAKRAGPRSPPMNGARRFCSRHLSRSWSAVG